MLDPTAAPPSQQFGKIECDCAPGRRTKPLRLLNNRVALEVVETLLRVGKSLLRCLRYFFTATKT